MSAVLSGYKLPKAVSFKASLKAEALKESKKALDSGFHVVDSGFQVLNSVFVSETWIPNSSRL